MASFNKVILVGNLTRDPELKYTPSGASVCEFGLAVSRTWFDKKANEKKEETAFVDLVAWGRTGEVINEYCHKGSPILVEGYLKLESWKDKESGANRSKLKVVVESMQLLGSKSKSQAPRGEESQDVPGSDEEVPF